MIRFLVVLILACWVHELGHAIASWVQGIGSIPTPLKTYTLAADVRWDQQEWILFGGVLGTFALSVLVLIWYMLKWKEWADSILAAVLVGPAAYSIRFLLVGRGHDGIEWQAAQILLGASPTGHMLDYAFLFLVAVGLIVWIVRKRTSLQFRSLLYLTGLLMFGFVTLVALQKINNAIFDDQFRGLDTDITGQPADLDPR